MTSPGDDGVLRGAPLVPRPDQLLSTSRAALDAPNTLAIIGDGVALDYRALAARLPTIQPEARFKPLRALFALDDALELLARLEHRVPTFLEHPSWSEALTLALRKRAADAAPLAGEALVLSTSGTSGSPRLVVHSRASLLASVAASAEHLGMPSPGDRWLLNLPLSHVGGLAVLLRCLTARQTLVLGAPRESPGAVLERIRRHEVTLISAVPTQLSRWLADPQFSAPPSLRAVLVGGAPLSSSLRRAAEERGLHVIATYAMTETASQIATDLPGRTPGLHLLPGFELRTEPSTGRLLVRGPQLFTRLLGEAPALTDGYYPTSDRVRFEGAGTIVVEGRLDSVIVTGGEKVSPEALEVRLLDALVPTRNRSAPGATEPGVSWGEMCIVGVPDPDWGERVVLLVEGAHEQHAEIAAALDPAIRGACARYERPKELLVVPELPRLGSAKLDRPAARELAVRLLAR